MSVTRERVLSALEGVQDPDLHRNIVELGFVKDLQVQGGAVSFKIELTTPACPVKDLMKGQAEEAVRAVPGVSRVEVTMTAQVRPSILTSSQGTLVPTVKHVVAVASGKGGVGKSTVSANLALALSRCGAAVGVMDGDVYGPSIPTILGITDGPEVTEDHTIIPVEHHGLRVISMGFFMKPDEAVIWRGPMLHKTVQQFLGGVRWGELDYLIVDLPPGTGDIQLSLCQSIPLTGAVIVSTPQEVALNVAQKAIVMFRKLNAPILGVIENMSHYACPACGHREEIFGSGGARQTAERLGLPFLGEIPLATRIRATADEGRPVVLSDPGCAEAKIFTAIAERLAAQISIRAMAGEIGGEIKVSF